MARQRNGNDSGTRRGKRFGKSRQDFIFNAMFAGIFGRENMRLTDADIVDIRADAAEGGVAFISSNRTSNGNALIVNAFVWTR